MPQDKDLKRLVRARMAASGENYTQALAHVRAGEWLDPLPPAWHRTGSHAGDYELGLLPGTPVVSGMGDLVDTGTVDDNPSPYLAFVPGDEGSELAISNYSAPNLRVQGPTGTTYAYRRFGKAGTIPVVFLQHFRGNLDNWDPALVDDIAAEREVILVDNSGVGLSTGTPAHTINGLARDILAFVDILGLTRIDLFGYSTGGFVAQEIVLLRPRLVRRLILAGTGPQGGRTGIFPGASRPRLLARARRGRRSSDGQTAANPPRAGGGGSFRRIFERNVVAYHAESCYDLAREDRGSVLPVLDL